MENIRSRTFVPSLHLVLRAHREAQSFLQTEEAETSNTNSDSQTTNSKILHLQPGQDISPSPIPNSSSESKFQDSLFTDAPHRTSGIMSSKATPSSSTSAPLLANCDVERVNGLLACPSCSKGFLHRAALEIHYRTHTGERPFSCDQCYKAFGTKGNLKAHMRTHSGEKPYACPECDKCFTQSVHLTRHAETHKEISDPLSTTMGHGTYSGGLASFPHQSSLHRSGADARFQGFHPSLTHPVNPSAGSRLDRILQELHSSGSGPHFPVTSAASLPQSWPSHLSSNVSPFHPPNTSSSK